MNNLEFMYISLASWTWMVSEHVNVTYNQDFFICIKTRNEMRTFRLTVHVLKFHSCTIYNVDSNSPFRNSSALGQFIREITVLILFIWEFIVLALSLFEVIFVYGVKSCGVQLFWRAVVVGQAPRPLSRLAIDN